MKKLLLLICTLGVLLMSCEKEDPQILYSTKFEVSSLHGLLIDCPDALSIEYNGNIVTINYDQEIWLFLINKSNKNIEITIKGETFNLKPEVKTSIPLILY